jgi:hypothetical protein
MRRDGCGTARALAGALFVVLAMALAAPPPALGWGFKGHGVVGAVADIVLARDHPDTAERVTELLGGKTLRDAATFPDCARSFSCGPRPALKAYAKRNEQHLLYHFADIPIQQHRYAAGSAGTKPFDVVQVLRYTVGVLRGQPPANVPANIKESEAVWVMAHLVGDIHQPLHVGAMFFDETCATPVDPNVVAADEEDFGIGSTIAETHGGNRLMITAKRQLHGLWDGQAVEDAMQLSGVQSGAIEDFARFLVDHPPGGWETKGNAAGWSQKWASEILPLAKEAHERLRIHPGVNEQNSHALVCTWPVELKPGYEAWAAEKARDQLAKAGFRLAAMLHAALGD